MNQDKEFKKILKKIEEKLEDEQTREELQDAIKRIEDIFEANIDVSIIYNVGSSEYSKVFDEYEKNDELPTQVALEDTMTLKDLKNLLYSEKDDYKICVDPLYLEKGINEINNILVTTLDDKLIIVPKKYNEE